MGKKKQKRGNRRRPPPKRRIAQQLLRTAGENPPAEAVTVAWTLAMLAALLAQLAALLAWSVRDANAALEEVINLPALLLFTAIVAGAICLILTPITYVVRRRHPPVAIAVFATLVSISPWLMRAVLSSWHG